VLEIRRTLPFASVFFRLKFLEDSFKTLLGMRLRGKFGVKLLLHLLSVSLLTLLLSCCVVQQFNPLMKVRVPERLLLVRAVPS
jgi:hypothetical protein